MKPGVETAGILGKKGEAFLPGEKDGLRHSLDRLFHGANYRWWVQATVCTGVLMSTLYNSVVNIALPVIMSQFKASLTTTEWVVLIYLLVTTSLLLSMGRLSDMIGRKRMYTSGFILFTLASGLAGISQSMTQLLAFRALQAVGAAMVGANSFAIITMAFPPQERGRALGLGGSMAALGIALGPTVGGILVQNLDWRSIFFLNVPVGIIASLMAYFILKEDRTTSSGTEAIRRFDYLGALLVVVILVSLLLSITTGQEGQWSSLLVRSGFALSALALGFFLFWQLRAKEPLVDLKLFKNRLFAAGNSARVFGFAATGANTLAMPFYLQLALGYSPLTAGLLMSASGLGVAIFAPISGWIADRTGERIISSFGLALNATGFFLLGYLTPQSYSGIAILLAMTGVGWGIFQAPNTSSVMSSTPRERYGIASGLVSLSRDIGNVLGVSMASAFLAMAMISVTGSTSLEGLRASALSPQRGQMLSAFLGGFRQAYLAAALLCVAAIIASLVRASGEKSRRE